MDFKDKIIFVSGANRGIGKAIVEALLKRGAKKIYAAARNPDQIIAEDARIEKITLDITDQAQIDAAANQCADTQILINNAGALVTQSAFEGTMDGIRRDMEVNYFGTLAMMRAFIPQLEKQDTAIIANVCSIASFMNFPFIGGYCASKAALYSITQGARMELAERNITVHSINPGPIDTNMADDIDMEKESPENTAEAILNGMERGDADIFPDPTGQGMFEAWREDYRSVERDAA